MHPTQVRQFLTGLMKFVNSCGTCICQWRERNRNKNLMEKAIDSKKIVLETIISSPRYRKTLIKTLQTKKVIITKMVFL